MTYYEDGFRTTLTEALTTSSIEVKLQRVPSGAPSFLVIEPGTDNFEVVKYETIAGLSCLLGSLSNRGIGNSTPKAHALGSPVIIGPVAEMYKPENMNYVDGSAVDYSFENLALNPNFERSIFNHRGATPDSWVDITSTPVQGGYPTLTISDIVNATKVNSANIFGLWNLNGDFVDSSSYEQNLVPGSTTASPTNTTSAFMARAKTFNRSSAQFSRVLEANAGIYNYQGSQSWAVLCKPSSVPATASDNDHRVVLQKMISTGGSNVAITLKNDTTDVTKAYFDFDMSGLSPDSVQSDVRVEAGKWYFIVGHYDGTNFSITVNGYTNSVTATGTPSSMLGDFSVGRRGGADSRYFDGAVQSVMTFNVGLSAKQAYDLSELILGSRVRITRDSALASIRGELPQTQLAQLRGKSATFSALVYQSIASTVRVGISDDGGASWTESATFTATNVWTKIFVRKDISQNSTGLMYRITHSTSNGNTWIQGVALNHGSLAFPLSVSTRKDYFQNTQSGGARYYVQGNEIINIGFSPTAPTGDNFNISSVLAAYPVGALYMSILNVNPNTYFGGSWVAFGAGRALVGFDGSDGDFDASEKTGGTKTHTLTEDQIPAHRHSATGLSTGNSGNHQHRSSDNLHFVTRRTTPGGFGVPDGGFHYFNSQSSFTDNISSHSHSISGNTANKGGGDSHPILQPYITVFMWKRTA